MNYKLKDQYGISVKDALLLIVESFDRYNSYKDIIMNQVGFDIINLIKN